MRASERSPSGESYCEARLVPEDSIESFTSGAFAESSNRQLLKESPTHHRHAILAACVAGLGAFVFGYTMGFTSPVLTAMEVLDDGAVFTDATIEQLDQGTASASVTISSSHAALFSSVVNVGAMVGAIVGGVACDKLGRKGTIVAAAVPFCGAWAWIAITSNFYELVIARLITGLMVGTTSVAVPMYLNEVAPTELRGSLGAVNQFGITLGILASYIVGLVVQQRRATVVGCSSIPGDATSSSSSSSSLVLYGKATDDLMCDDLVSGWSCEESDGGLDACEGTLPNWRVLAWVAAGASAFLCVAMSLMPESPVYLFKSGRSDRARRALLFLRGGSDVHADYEIKELERTALVDSFNRASDLAAPRLPSRSHSKGMASGVPFSGHPSAAAAAAAGTTASGSAGGQPPSTTAAAESVRSPLVEPLYGGHDDISKEDQPEISDRVATSYEQQQQQQNNGVAPSSCLPPALSVLCGDEMRRPLATGVAIMFFQQLSGINAVIFYSGSILQTAGMDDANLGAVFVMVAQVAFTALSLLLMDRFGRRVLLGSSALGMALSGLALAGFYFNGKQPAWLALVSLLGFIASFSVGMGPVPWLFLGEIFPAHARASACSLATLVNWSLSFVVTFVFDELQALLKPQGCFVLFAGFCVAGVVFAVTVMPETKGKSFEVIAREFRTAAGGGRALSFSTEF